MSRAGAAFCCCTLGASARWYAGTVVVVVEEVWTVGRQPVSAGVVAAAICRALARRATEDDLGSHGRSWKLNSDGVVTCTNVCNILPKWMARYVHVRSTDMIQSVGERSSRLNRAGESE